MSFSFSLSLQMLCERFYAEAASKYIKAAQALYRRGGVKVMISEMLRVKRFHYRQRIKNTGHGQVGKYVLKI